MTDHLMYSTLSSCLSSCLSLTSSCLSLIHTTVLGGGRGYCWYQLLLVRPELLPPADVRLDRDHRAGDDHRLAHSHHVHGGR